MEDVWETGRIEAFSDGVFAIAITLLVLDIAVPESDFDDLWGGIANQWPSYLGYVTSFITVGGIWMAHHGMFRRLKFANKPVMVTNLVLLMAVAFLPFPTRLLADTIHDSGAERAAVIFYGGNLLVISILMSTLWGAVMRDRRLLRPEVTDEEAGVIMRIATPNIGFYVAVIVLAFVAPQVAAFGYLVIAVVAVLRVGGTIPTPSSTADEST